MRKYEPREHIIDAELASGNLDAWKQALGFPRSSYERNIEGKPLMTIHPDKIHWRRIENDGPNRPPERVNLLVCGPSYMTTSTHYVAIAYYDEDFRPRSGADIRWIDLYHNAVTDGNAQPTHWVYQPEWPKD